MGIFDRFSSLLKSNINDLISKAEDPEKMLTQILVDMRGQLVKAVHLRRERAARGACAQVCLDGVVKLVVCD